MANRRIASTFAALRERGEKAFIPYITAGDPDLATTVDLCRALARAGADLIELGLPFSDPLADGPVIQQATRRALKAGTTTDKVFDLVAALRRDPEMPRAAEIPIVLLTYYNPVFRYGVERFLDRAAAAGLDGLVVPDLPLEEAEELRNAAAQRGLDLILFMAPTSTDDRLAATARAAQGFIYCVSLTGVTGAREQLSDRAAELCARARRHTDLPLAVGFGISTPEQAAAMGRVADAAIVGSAIVRLIGEAVEGSGTSAPDRAQLVERVTRYAEGIKAALK